MYSGITEKGYCLWFVFLPHMDATQHKGTTFFFFFEIWVVHLEQCTAYQKHIQIIFQLLTKFRVSDEISEDRKTD